MTPSPGPRATGWSPGAVLVLGLTVLAACDIPRDPRGTLERARGGMLRVGVVDAPPWVVRDGNRPAGPEVELVRAFAESIGAEADWRWGSLDAHLHALERFEIDIVAAGLTDRSPWKSHVAFTRPWREEGGRRHVVAVPPGENRMLVELERLIESRAGPGR